MQIIMALLLSYHELGNSVSHNYYSWLNLKHNYDLQWLFDRWTKKLAKISFLERKFRRILIKLAQNFKILYRELQKSPIVNSAIKNRFKDNLPTIPVWLLLLCFVIFAWTPSPHSYNKPLTPSFTVLKSPSKNHLVFIFHRLLFPSKKLPCERAI